MSDWLRSMRAAPRTTLERIRLLTPGRFWEGAGIGLLAIGAGGAAMLFHGIAAWIEHNTIGRLAHLPVAWFLLGSLATVLGGSFLASWIIAQFAPAAAGGGVLPVKLAFWRDFGAMRKREGAVKLVASAITLGSGVSMGPEGPSMQIGAAVMSSIAGSAGVAKQSRRVWCAAGAAAGLAAVFNAPLAAITFVLEEVIGDLHSRLLGRVVVAAVVGALIGHAVLGPQPAFQSSPLGALTWRGWALVPVVALVGAAGGAWFLKLSMSLRGRLRTPRPKRFAAYHPLIGALVSWVVGVLVFVATGHLGIFGIGYGDVTAALAGRLGLATVFMLFVGKLLATAGAVGSGGCGGIFAPSLFIGAMGGATMASLTALVLPLNRSDAAMLVMTGMTASLGAVIRTPLTSVLLIFEVTNQWVVVPALMIGAIISQAVSLMVNKHDYYEQVMLQDGLDPHQVLPPRTFKRWREIPVTALATFKPMTASSLDRTALSELLGRSRHERFPFVGPDGRVKGVLPRREAEMCVAEGHEPRLEPAQWVTAKAMVGEARKQMLAGGADFLCVGDAATGELQGILTLHDLLRGESVLEEDAAT